MTKAYSLNLAGERAAVWLAMLSDETLLGIYADLGLETIIDRIPLDSDVSGDEARCEAVTWHLRRYIVDGCQP